MRLSHTAGGDRIKPKNNRATVSQLCIPTPYPQWLLRQSRSVGPAACRTIHTSLARGPMPAIRSAQERWQSNTQSAMAQHLTRRLRICCTIRTWPTVVRVNEPQPSRPEDGCSHGGMSRYAESASAGQGRHRHRRREPDGQEQGDTLRRMKAHIRLAGESRRGAHACAQQSGHNTINTACGDKRQETQSQR